MSKEKQIEEMTKVIQSQRYINNDPCIYDCAKCGKCLSYKIAESLNNEGYCKQSEGDWISVEDRLPTYKDGKVLIYTAYGISIAEITVSGRWKGANAIPKFITHWKPLPEPPKMKGE